MARAAAALMVVIIGAGAAGVMAAIHARAAGADVTMVESTADGGRKILISGGGRCNVLPAALEPQRFVTSSPPALVSRLLRSWPLLAQRHFFEDDLAVPLTFEAEDRKFFPASHRARDVRDALIARAREANVSMRFGTVVSGLTRKPDEWVVETSAGPLSCARVIVATGGLSVPATGSTGLGFQLARALGHTVHPTYAALTPLEDAGGHHVGLAGVSLTVRLRARWRDETAEMRGGFLFTHRGFSGPSILDVSHIAVRSRLAGERADLRVQWTDLAPEAWAPLLAPAPVQVVTIVARHVPRRLAEHLIHAAGLPADHRASSLTRLERRALIDRLTAYALPWTGDAGYQKAEVTGGGVALDEVDPVTLESRRAPGVHFCGEVLDAFGPIGGHNFAWAWSTGRLAGRAAGHVVNRVETARSGQNS